MRIFLVECIGVCVKGGGSHKADGGIVTLAKDKASLLLRRHTFLPVQESMQRMTRGLTPLDPCGSDMLRRGVPVAKLAALLWNVYAVLTASL